MRLLRLLAVPLVILVSARGAAATPVTFDFTGTVDYRVTFGTTPALEAGIVGGAPITGSYTFDSGATNSNTPADAIYHSLGAPFGFVVNVGGLTITDASSNPNLQIDVSDDSGGSTDLYAVIQHNLAGSGLAVTTVQWSISSAAGADPFSSNALPLIPFDPSQFNLVDGFYVNFNTGNPVNFFYGNITTLTLAPVPTPEPGSLALLVAGAALPLIRSRRRRAA
jgi:hypothetical protein